MQLGVSKHRHVVVGENHTAAVPAAGQVCMATSFAAAFMLAAQAFICLQLVTVVLSLHRGCVSLAGVFVSADCSVLVGSFPVADSFVLPTLCFPHFCTSTCFYSSSDSLG
jgi:hypothetical protein